MEDVLTGLLIWVRGGVVLTFAVLTIVAARRARRGGSAGWWVSAMFGALAVSVGAGVIRDALGVQPPWLGVGSLVLLLSFPYLLLRFAASFHPFHRVIEVAAVAAFAAVIGATLLLPPPDAAAASWMGVYLVGALAYWTLVSAVTIVRLWSAGREQPTVARRRMRLMSTACLVLTVALLVSAATGEGSALLAFLIQLTALICSGVFALGFAPPRALRLSWRQAEERHLQEATVSVLRADTPEAVTAALLPPTVRVLGASGAALVDADGAVVATHGTGDPPSATELAALAAGRRPSGYEAVSLGEGLGTLVVSTSVYTPFFGEEEMGLLRSMGAVAGLALQRAYLLHEERAQRYEVDQARHDAELAREEAHRANSAKTDFLSRMSHELRTPLNAILGFGQLLEISDLSDDDRDATKHILKAGRHLLELINDVLDLSKIEAGQLTISLEPVHCVELISDTVGLIKPLADRRSIRLIARSDAADQYIATDRQRCRQVLLNLLSNAVKYNHDGGQVELRCTQSTPGTLRILVRDSGPGIDLDRQHKLFQPFERLGAESSAVEGTGLGLALSKQLVERMGGTIGVDSAPGRGSTFWIDVPVTERPQPAGEIVIPPPALPATRPQSLLLVEDNLANLHLVEAMLGRRPEVAVIPAMQGGLAIELASQHQPDAIVLDLHLPDLPGREVLNRLKADPRTRDIPVVIATADASPGRGQRLREEGAFDYVTKPLDLTEFLSVVDAALASNLANP